MGKMQREKGKRFERHTANLFRDSGIASFSAAKRSYGQSRRGDDAPDVDGIGEFWIECKAGRCPNIRAALTQATKASEGTGRFPVVVSKRDREEILITFKLSDFFEWLRNRE